MSNRRRGATHAALAVYIIVLPVNDNQSVDLAFRDQPRRNGGFPERRRSTQDTFVMGNDLRNGFLLERPKLTLELGAD